MDPEEYSFLNQIRLQPEDITARLIYADWLEENEDPRSELIRLQCEKFELLPADPDLHTLKSRERELLDLHADSWLEPLGQLGNPFITFDRGLLSNVVVDAEWFVKNSKALFELLPSVSKVRLRNVRSMINAVAKLDCSHLAELDFSGNLLRHEEIVLLGQNGLFARLESLNLDMNRLSNLNCFTRESRRLPNGMQAPIGELKSLDVDSNCVSTRRGQPAISDDLTTSLQHLDLSRNVNQYQTPLDLFACIAACGGLRSLEMDCNRIGDDELRVLSQLPIATGLKRLSLRKNQIGYEGCGYFVKRHLFGELRELDLAGNRIDDRAAMRIAHSGSLQNLRLLDLREQFPNSRWRETAPFTLKTRYALREKYGFAVLFDEPNYR